MFYHDRIVTSSAKNLRVSPRKLGLVAGLIRGDDVVSADAQLQFSKRRIAKDVLKCLRSAVANAENNFGMDVDNLYVHEIYVGKAGVMKRSMPRAKGRASRINKFLSNIVIKLKEKNYGSES